MSQIIFTAPRQVELQEQRVPAVGPRQFRLRTECSLVSTGTETIILSGDFEPDSHWDNWVRFPFSPGYCAVGFVDEVGDEVQTLKVGERVATRSPHAQFAILDEHSWVDPLPVPDEVSSDEAVWFGMATIAQNGVRRAEHELGDNVVIIGAGLLGQLVTQYLRVFGAREIIVVDTSSARLELSKNHGASHVLQMGAGDAHDAIWDLTRGRGADVVYDVTGHPAVFAPALGLARGFGKLLLLGDAARPGDQRLTPDVMTRGVQILAAHDTHALSQPNPHFFWTNRNMGELFFHFLQTRQMSVAPMITHRYTPDEAPRAYDQLLRDRSSALGVLFDWR